MNFYEHTIIARQDTSPGQLKQLQEKYTNLISELKVKEYKFKIIRHRKKDALFQRIFKNFKRN